MPYFELQPQHLFNMRLFNEQWDKSIRLLTQNNNSAMQHCGSAHRFADEMQYLLQKHSCFHGDMYSLQVKKIRIERILTHQDASKNTFNCF